MKILHFVGLCTFVANEEAVETNFGKGLWDKDLVVTHTEEVQPEDMEIPLPLPIEEMGKGIIGKVPRFPNEGINEIEGWIVCDSVEEGEQVLESFKGQFGEVHNKPKEIDPFLQFLKEMLKGLRSDIENNLGEETENVDKPEEMTQEHDTEG